MAIVDNGPLVSIVLPTFNGSKYIATTIKSCLKQSYRNIELIIVNDCSTDSTQDIIKELSNTDKRIKIFNNSINKKLPASLNVGFSLAEGEFYTWISDDNYFSENAIETLLGSLIGELEYSLVYSSYWFVDVAGKKLDSFGHIPEELIFKCSPGACFLYKKEVHWNLKGYDEQKFRMEDMDFWLRAATKFRFKYIDDKDLYYYRKHNNNLTASIFSNFDLYKEYRSNHALSFEYLFKKGLGYDITNDEIELHLELYFNYISINKEWTFSISEKIVNYINYLDKLKNLPWGLIGFDVQNVLSIINNKKDYLIKLVINDLLLENQLLLKKKPQLANQFNKPISWYYKEYEVLPDWYKKIGHIIKALQGNRPWKSLFKFNR